MQNPMIELKSFNENNLPLVVDVVVPLWSPPVGDYSFKRFNVEFIVRNNISENKYQFELIDSNSQEFLAAAFFTRKGDLCRVEEWYEKECTRFPEELRRAINMTRVYLRQMDQRTLSFMKDDDIKLSLFVSRHSGSGSQLLNQLYPKLKEEGWKNLFLWTDCECNWSWYNKHGFTLVEEASYEPFSNEQEDFKTYIFKKVL